jgi:DNA-binding CsgD family transcriptional regulator
MTATTFSADLVGAIYDAATDPDGLGRLPELFARVGQGGSAVVGLVHCDGAMEAATSGLPEDALLRYAARYHAVNPFYDALMRSGGPRVEALCGGDFVSEQRLRQTEFYWDFARGLETVQIIGGVMPVAEGWLAELGVHRGERSKRYDRRDLARVGRLMPHLQRALQLRLKLGVGERSLLGFAALDALAVGCAVCDAQGRVLFANAAAEDTAKAGGLSLSGRNGLCARAPEDARRLAALLVDVGAGGSGGIVMTSGESGRKLFALVAPLPQRFGGRPGHALVAMRLADAAPTVDPTNLRRLFGLTEAEARLTCALLAGRSLAAIGTERGVSENTLRTQLAAVLRKTDSDCQRDLVRRLGLIPPVLLTARDREG